MPSGLDMLASLKAQAIQQRQARLQRQWQSSEAAKERQFKMSFLREQTAAEKELLRAKAELQKELMRLQGEIEDALAQKDFERARKLIKEYKEKWYEGAAKGFALGAGQSLGPAIAAGILAAAL